MKKLLALAALGALVMAVRRRLGGGSEEEFAFTEAEPAAESPPAPGEATPAQ